MENHLSPQYNLNGNLVQMLEIKKNEQTKDPWPGRPRIRTRQELLSERKKEFLPDPSYDIDNDGFVSHKDFFISKQFDDDKDRKLNETERNNAENALKSGFLDKFKLGLESRVPNFEARIIQKRGVIMDNDANEKIVETYPIMRNTSLPVISSRKQLICSRKHLPISGRQCDNVFRVETIRVEPEDYVKEPKISSFKEIKNSFNQTARIKQGLTEPIDFKLAKFPSTDYILYPKYSSQTQMNTQKKKEHLENLQEKANYNHISREEHLKEREKFLIFYNEGTTIKDLKEKVKKETNNYNQNTFYNISIGVHGKELPKFTDNLKEYWKIKENYTEEPKNSSQTLFNMQKLNLGPIDKYRESDITGKEIPKNKYKIVKKKYAEVADKPNHVIPYGGYSPVENTEFEYKKTNTKYKRSTIVGHFLNKAEEMGIKMIIHEDKEVKTERTVVPESNVSQILELPKTSNSNVKKVTFRQTTSHNPLRTTGFIVKNSSES
ncbi:hypothetical protein SteCoe_2359 [Stentor coeruleus]|uniref:EF-hand domain-containing protein n=1 Tax=Stentor coeruleus TaxID=5963 RepID=A0A1R2CZN3_9CILI|nr:hypothetical protein SteCoe_2359 [Stentor coeruleus]